jgi:hypothetical protein
MQGTWQWLDTLERKQRQPKTRPPISALMSMLGSCGTTWQDACYQNSLRSCHQPTKPAPPTQGLHDAHNLAASRDGTCNIKRLQKCGVRVLIERGRDQMLLHLPRNT